MITLTNLLAEGDRSLADFTGSLVLVGAGKMGSAMLDGWLNLGLDFRQVVLIEPHPSLHIGAFTARGARLNPPPAEVTDASVVVIAVKPQTATQAMPQLRAMARTVDACRVDHGGTKTAIHRTRPERPRGRSRDAQPARRDRTWDHRCRGE